MQGNLSHGELLKDSEINERDLYTASQISRTSFLNHPCNLILIEMQRDWLLYSYEDFNHSLYIPFDWDIATVENDNKRDFE